MFNQLAALNSRPEPFSVYTAETLWTDPHISSQMLAFHLDAGSDLASRNHSAIARIGEWLHENLRLAGKKVCDLGCGPGLYARTFAKYGAQVTGLDFSKRSIDYAIDQPQKDGMAITYRQADYLKDDLPSEQDVVCLIYGDLCLLSPDQRTGLYRKVRRSLNPGGRFVFDVFPIGQSEQRQEGMSYGRRLMNGFWAPGDYFGFLTTYLYAEQNLALDRYLIVEPHRQWEVFNWFQYFEPEDICKELLENGFSDAGAVDMLTGQSEISPDGAFAVIATA